MTAAYKLDTAETRLRRRPTVSFPSIHPPPQTVAPTSQALSDMLGVAVNGGIYTIGGVSTLGSLGPATYGRMDAGLGVSFGRVDDYLINTPPTTNPDWSVIQASTTVTSPDENVFPSAVLNPGVAPRIGEITYRADHYWGTTEASTFCTALAVEDVLKPADTAAITYHHEMHFGAVLMPWFITDALPDAFKGYEQYAAPNWDGYGAQPITSQTVAAARMFLRAMPRDYGEPDIAPGADGTIGFEWYFSSRPIRKLFIDIGPGSVWKGFCRKASGEHKLLSERAIGRNLAHELARLFRALEV